LLERIYGKPSQDEEPRAASERRSPSTSFSTFFTCLRMKNPELRARGDDNAHAGGVYDRSQDEEPRAAKVVIHARGRGLGVVSG